MRTIMPIIGSLMLFLLFTVSLTGCMHLGQPYSGQIDKANVWLGKSKDERVKAKGPAAQCAKLSTGEESCEWRTTGVSQAAIDCPPDLTHGGHQCSGGGGGSWEHHLIFTYDHEGIAREWSYWGSWGERSSRSAAQEAQAPAYVASKTGAD